MAVDPVCEMHVDEQQATATAEHGGRTYYFCSDGCKTRFQEAPEKYIARQRENEKSSGG